MAHTGKAFLNALNNKLDHLDIRRNYYALLLIENGSGSITQQDLADMLDTDKVSVMRIVDYLSANGYIKREKKKEDQRKYLLILTAKARKEMKGIKKAIDDLTESAFKGIDKTQRSQFEKTLRQISENIKEINRQK